MSNAEEVSDAAFELQDEGSSVREPISLEDPVDEAVKLAP
jgi:hypothetical protein